MPYSAFQFSWPTELIFGCGESGKTGEHVARRRPRRVLVVTYAGPRLSVLSSVLEQLAQNGVPFSLWDGCVPNPRCEDADAGAAAFAALGCDMVLGVGGGSVIDTAKAIALLAANPGEGGIYPYLTYQKTPDCPAFPVALVVTIASTGSECNESFVLTSPDGKQKLICSTPSVRPVFSVLDPCLSVTLPARQTALGAADILSHALEQYLHADNFADVSDNMALGLMKAVVKWAPVALRKPDDLDARSNLLFAGSVVMSRILGVGHRENWVSHMLEHAVSARYDLAHGAGMSAILPWYIRHIAREDAGGKLTRLSFEVFGTKEPADRALGGFLQGIGMPVTLREALGAPADEQTLRALAENALTWGDMEAGGYAPFTREDAYRVLKAAFEG